ncbi:hypothetical protein LMG33818_001689 [Halomonadaceae bacterium LMG 33818]|uniref:CsbD family protein n=1 Tax=Cernens ardua TaxID=3402176 RepID=UPI003EDBEA2B
MVKERIEGKTKELAGQAQEAFGDFSDDDEQSYRGKARQAAGQIQSGYGEAVDQVRDLTQSNPIGALAAAAAVGFILGKLWR